MNDSLRSNCPLPNTAAGNCIQLAHGEGGSLMRRLLAEHILPGLGRNSTDPHDDAMVLPSLNGLPVLTTDAFVVSPLFFPGGDIGTLAVYGTINDLVVRGAEPLWLTLSMVLEEGLPMAVLDRVLESIADAARRCNVTIAAGDTKVVPRGAADKMFLSTTGLGRLVEPAPMGASTIEIGDVLLVSGPIGRHGIAILAAREEMAFDPPPATDCAALIETVAALRRAGVRPRALRDATRGGVTAVLHEWARDCGWTLVVDETSVPVSREVRGVCELLGLDPFCVANEGTLVAAVAPHEADIALEAMRSVPTSSQAAQIGEVRTPGTIPVLVRRTLGREQPLIEPSGAPLPRIC
jgi:hydrogenase expression/formation protein HypE